MALTLQRTANGNLLRLTNGNMQGSCCCGTTPQPSSCPGGDPELQITVFDADYSGGNITWCGETWTQVQVQAGDTRTICPSSYSIGATQSAFGTSCFSGYQEIWQYGTELALRATWRGPYTLGIYGTQQFHNNVTVNPPGEFFKITGFQTFSTRTSGGACRTAPVGKVPVTGNPTGVYTTYGFLPPTFADSGPRDTFNGMIADDFFGRFSNGGIQYTWEKGNGW